MTLTRRHARRVRRHARRKARGGTRGGCGGSKRRHAAGIDPRPQRVSSRRDRAHCRSAGRLSVRRPRRGPRSPGARPRPPPPVLRGEPSRAAGPRPPGRVLPVRLVRRLPDLRGLGAARGGAREGRRGGALRARGGLNPDGRPPTFGRSGVPVGRARQGLDRTSTVGLGGRGRDDRGCSRRIGRSSGARWPDGAWRCRRGSDRRERARRCRVSQGRGRCSRAAGGRPGRGAGVPRGPLGAPGSSPGGGPHPDSETGMG